MTVAIQPWSEIVWPDMWANARLTATRVKGIPAIGRGLALIGGLAKQMPLDDLRGDVVLPRPGLLEQPDPDQARSWFVDVQIEDYLVHGNALHLVTSRGAFGQPLSAVWLPAAWTTCTRMPDGQLDYWCAGVRLNTEDVVHVRRGAHPLAPWVGVGMVEQFLDSLGVMVDQSTYESRILKGSAVPSVVIVAPHDDLGQEEIDAAQTAWLNKYGGPNRVPAVLPKGTEVRPLAWSPSDSQLVEARQLGLVDAANMMNIDAYWVGAQSTGYNYKSPGPMYLNLVRQTVSPILEDFEGVWSMKWLPRGRRVRFARNVVMTDDMQTTAGWVASLLKNKIITLSEARVYLGLGAEVPDELKPKPVPDALQPGAGGQDPAAPAAGNPEEVPA
ncbi:MAG: hypothetical protein CVT66_06235 [Actinobacteria bacterium HGW-Actinobacteria-6]|nr:MAG: hypothetical protein CVT66_06235 [Actinobacteria bacterium HGW-Actinobacteria-6]